MLPVGHDMMTQNDYRKRPAEAPVPIPHRQQWRMLRRETTVSTPTFRETGDKVCDRRQSGANKRLKPEGSACGMCDPRLFEPFQPLCLG